MIILIIRVLFLQKLIEFDLSVKLALELLI